MALAYSFGPLRRRDPVRSPDDGVAVNPWRDFEDGLTRLDATVTDINITGSLPSLQLRGPDGMNWTVELADHARNRATGLASAPILQGDLVQVVGRCAHGFGENRIKAISLQIGDARYDLYPVAQETA